MSQLSFIVPVYNAAATLNACIDSILKQTYSNWELHLVDDGSSDASPALCRQFAANDDRIHYHHLSHGGVSNARKAGISYSRTPYVAFVDADDAIHPAFAETMLANLAHHDSDICVCGYRTVTDSETTPYLPTPSASPLRSLFCDEGVEGFLWNKVYRRALLTEDLFDSLLLHCEDLYLNTILFSDSHNRISFEETPLYDYHLQGSSATRTTHYFTENSTFLYEPAFRKIVQFLSGRQLITECTYARHKYANILEYSMYCLLKASTTDKQEIRLLKRTMQKASSPILTGASLSFKEKLRYLLLSFAPHLYKAIRLES